MFARMDTTSHKHGAVRSARLSPECRTVLSGDLSFSAPVIHRNSSCACGGGCPSCRAKSNELNVSQPDDPAESEADQIADRIMRMSVDEVLSDSNLPHSVARLYRTSDVEEEGAAFSDNIQCQVAVTPTTPTVSSDGTPPLIQNVMNSGGQPLDRQTRSFFEPRFGCDLSSVRIHADGTAGESARTISARAYALDNHIVFGDGEYRPETSAGKLLLAHELAHIVQDRRATRDGGAALAIRRQKKARHDKSAPKGKEFTVELDHGHEGRYRIYFQEPHSRDEVLALLFVDGVLPDGYALEDNGIDLLGWGWKLRITGNSISLDTFSQLTSTFQQQLRVGVLALTPDESADHRRRVEAFKDSRPAFLGGKSVREAFAECPDKASGETGCWGKRAGVLYYIGFQAGDRGRVLQWRDLPQSSTIVRDIEYWLRRGDSLHDAETKVRQQWAELKVKLILGFVNSLSAVPGTLNRPTLPISPLKQGGIVVSTGAQTYEAWKMALGHDITEADALLMGLGGLMGHATSLSPLNKQLPRVNLPPRGVGRIIDGLDGIPHKVLAITPDGVEVLHPIVKVPSANRALPSGSTGSADVPNAKPPIGVARPGAGTFMPSQTAPFDAQLALPPGSIFLQEPPRAPAGLAPGPQFLSRTQSDNLDLSPISPLSTTPPSMANVASGEIVSPHAPALGPSVPGPKQPNVYVRFQPQTFATQDAAAIDALKLSNPYSIAAGRELAGQTFQTPQGRWGYSGPVMIPEEQSISKGRVDSRPEDAAVHPDWGIATGDFHTHGGYQSVREGILLENPRWKPDDFRLQQTPWEPDTMLWQHTGNLEIKMLPDEFSFADIQRLTVIAREAGVRWTSYVGTPSGKFRMMYSNPEDGPSKPVVIYPPGR